MIGRIVVLCLLLAAAPAGATSVSVVATGDPDLQATLARHVEGWLRKHGHAIGEPLPRDVTNTLLNCMVIEDQGCARGLVQARATSDAVLYAQAIRSRTSDALVLNIYWFIKGKEPIGMRRACEECSPDLMRSTIEEVLATLVGASTLARGRLVLHSKPAGMTVLLDNENVGITPLEREVPAGPHTIVLVHRGQRVGERSLDVDPDVTAEITIPVTLPAESPTQGRSGLAGGLVMGLGVATLAAGVALYVTSEEDDGSKLYYRDTRALGIGVAAGGAVITGVGVWLWLRARGSEHSAPVVSLSRDGGVVGWTRAF